MRWLMISLLVSLLLLLIAVAGMAYHIRVQHKQLRRRAPSSVDEAFEKAEENRP